MHKCHRDIFQTKPKLLSLHYRNGLKCAELHEPYVLFEQTTMFLPLFTQKTCNYAHESRVIFDKAKGAAGDFTDNSVIICRPALPSNRIPVLF